MRPSPLFLPALLLAALGGCTGAPAVGPLLGAEGASVIVLGRGLADLGVSAISGRDCSIVRLDRGQTYCAPPEEQRAADLFCTRTLATPDCWTDPALLPAPRRGIGDTPPSSTAQDRHRVARWPKSLFAD
jgi:hypothetical protein